MNAPLKRGEQLPMPGPHPWVERLWDAMASGCLNCPRPFVVEYDGSGPGLAKCQACGRLWDVTARSLRRRE